jgi:hypothetical protein
MEFLDKKHPLAAAGKLLWTKIFRVSRKIPIASVGLAAYAETGDATIDHRFNQGLAVMI